MSAPTILRVIRFDEASERSSDIALAGFGLATLAIAGLVLLTAARGDREAQGLELILVITGLALVATAAGGRRWLRSSRIYVVADAEGLIWGTDRSRDLSLPWTAIAKIRAVPDPYREGLMYAFAFEPVPGYVSPGQRRDLRAAGGGDYHYFVDTRAGDCTPDEFRSLIASRRPDLPILFGSFRDPA